ncbi:hypothetical protein DMH03_20865 [Amycolatopsis sp. WAC 01376]|nr:hypothetical protein DMH03_20865 [Amycolatopsis sp. WAC 01376]
MVRILFMIRYGPWKIAHERLRKWTADGTWDRVLEHVIVKGVARTGSKTSRSTGNASDAPGEG